MPDQNSQLEEIRKLLDSQLEGVLASLHNQQPYTNLMTFAHTPDLKKLIIATKRNTQKFKNLQTNPQVSFLVDNRTNTPSDYQHATAISAIGKVVELEGEHYDIAKDMFLERLPQLRSFMHGENCTLMAISVDHYFLVSQFHDLKRLDMHSVKPLST